MSRRALAAVAAALALVVACDGGGPGEPTPPLPAVGVTSVDTLRPGGVAFVRGSGLTALRSLLLDGIEATLNELAEPHARRAAIEHIVRSQTAPLLCRQATCRRARSCRRKPCTVPSLASA